MKVHPCISKFVIGVGVAVGGVLGVVSVYLGLSSMLLIALHS